MLRMGVLYSEHNTIPSWLETSGSWNYCNCFWLLLSLKVSEAWASLILSGTNVVPTTRGPAEFKLSTCAPAPASLGSVSGTDAKDRLVSERVYWLTDTSSGAEGEIGDAATGVESGVVFVEPRATERLCCEGVCFGSVESGLKLLMGAIMLAVIPAFNARHSALVIWCLM